MARHRTRAEKRAHFINKLFHYAGQDGLCAYCAEPMLHPSDTWVKVVGQPHPPRMMTIDHVVPRSKGGIEGRTNQVACCYQCNLAKGSEQKPFKLSRDRLRYYVPPSDVVEDERVGGSI